MAEKKQELEKRLQDVTGQLGTPAAKKTPKKGQFAVNPQFSIPILSMLPFVFLVI